MSTATTTITAEPGSPVVEIMRDFNATPEELLRAHVDPQLVARWLGPRRLEIEITEMDPRHGGRYRFVHHEADRSASYGFRGVFHGDPTTNGIVRTFEYEGAPGHISLESVRFEDLGGGQTRLHAQAVHQTVESRDAMIANGMERGVVEGYERLDDVLTGA